MVTTMAIPQVQTPFPAVGRTITGALPSFSPFILVGTALSTMDDGMLAHCPVSDSTAAGSPIPCYEVLTAGSAPTPYR
ncbi:MAG: hypothetical protein IPN44_13270 [Flavobacteriales bacterium]|nr:hypothetical protein [Flavobacteriales bacterium]